MNTLTALLLPAGYPEAATINVKTINRYDRNAKLSFILRKAAFLLGVSQRFFWIFSDLTVSFSSQQSQSILDSLLNGTFCG